jgi:hypothetical protein
MRDYLGRAVIRVAGRRLEEPGLGGLQTPARRRTFSTKTKSSKKMMGMCAAVVRTFEH